MHEFLRPAGVRPARTSRIDLTEAILELIKADLGVTAMARWAAAGPIAEGALVAIPLGAKGLHREWTAVYRPEAAGSHYVRDFVEQLGRDAFPVRRGTPALHTPAKSDRARRTTVAA